MDTNKRQKQAEFLIKKGLALGAEDIITFEQKDIVYDARAFLKCIFGCGGDQPSCPTSKDATLVETYRKAVSGYKWGILIRAGDEKKGQDIALALEREAFFAGNQFALACTGCAACEDCVFNRGEECVHPELSRPALCAVGIDVFSTLKGLGWELKILQTMDEPATNITAVFVD